MRGIQSIRISSLITVLVGVWLGISVALFDLEGFSFWNQILASIAFITLGTAELYSKMKWVGWLSGLVAAWLIISTFMSGAAAGLFWNMTLGALIVLAMSAWDDAMLEREYDVSPSTHRLTHSH